MTLNTEQAFAAKICIGLAVGFWLVLWRAFQEDQPRPIRWLDAYLGTLVGGVIGARAMYVLLHIERFWKDPLNIPRLWYGELAWQGAILGGGLAMWALCRWRRVPYAAFMDGIALAFPVGFMAVSWAARSAGLLLGQRVANLDAHPVWMAGFLPALDRDVQPRYELQMLGLAMGAAILVLIGVLTMLRLVTGIRLWFALAAFALAVLVLDHYLAPPQQRLYGIQVNQISAGILWLVSLGMIVYEWSAKRIEYTVSPARSDTL